MNRRDMYFRQLVSESDFDEVLDLAENADRALTTDAGLIGVYFGLAIAEAGVPNLTVQCSGGSAYDSTGQRIAIPGTQIVNVAVDSNAVSTTVAGAGNSKIISVFAKFRRALSNPKNDGNNQLVQYNRDESFEFIVEQSNEGVGPTPPALKSDAVLLADITRTFGVTQVENAAISGARRQWAIDVTAGTYSVRVGRVEEAFQAVVSALNSLDGAQAAVVAALDGVVTAHITAVANAHAGTAISNTPAGTITATTVQAAINELDTDVQGHITAVANAHAGTAISNTPAGNVASTTVQAAINELDTKKGAVALTNTWSLLQVYQGGMTLIPTVGTRYTRMRSYPALDATDNDMVTMPVRLDLIFASGVGVNVTVFSNLEVPNNTHGMLSMSVVFSRTAAGTFSTFQQWAVGYYKTGGTVTLQGSTLLADIAGSGGHQATGVTWNNSGGAIVLTFNAPGGNGRVAITGTYQISRFD